MYRAKRELYLDREEGICVLSVAVDKERTSYFYLDKPVSLKQNVCFALIPHGKSCSIKLYMDNEDSYETLELLNGECFKQQIIPEIEMKSIYTFFYQEKEKGFFFKGERHDLYELIYVDKGSVHNVVNSSDTLLTQGEMMIYAPGEWHVQYADVDVAPSFVTITFDMSCVFSQSLFERRFKLSPEGAQLLKRMLKERDNGELYSGDMILCLLKMLIITAWRSGYGEAQKLKTSVSEYNENEIINRALTYIAKNVSEKLSVTYVARQINISASYLTAIFHERLRIAPGEYIRRIKLEESKALIREGKMNFTQIAQKLKYSTVHHFSRQFKEQFGITPTQYAKAIR